MRAKKCALAVILSLCMVLTLIPGLAFAEDAPGNPLGGKLDGWFNGIIGTLNETIKDKAVIGEVAGQKADILVVDPAAAQEPVVLAIVRGLLQGLYETEGAIDAGLTIAPPTRDESGNCAYPDEPKGNCMDQTTGAITFTGLGEDFFGEDPEKEGISSFAKWACVWTGGSSTQPLSELIGGNASIQFTINNGDESTEAVSYVFSFKLQETGPSDAKPDDVVLTGEGNNQTLTGDGLVDEKTLTPKTAADVKAMFKDETGWTIYKGETEVADTASVGTGYVARHVVNGAEIETVTIVVPGDVDGDADIDTTDAQEILDEVVSKIIGATEPLTGAYEKAAHIKGGKITTDDVVALLDKIVAAAA